MKTTNENQAEIVQVVKPLPGVDDGEVNPHATEEHEPHARSVTTVVKKWSCEQSDSKKVRQITEKPHASPDASDRNKIGGNRMNLSGNRSVGDRWWWWWNGCTNELAQRTPSGLAFCPTQRLVVDCSASNHCLNLLARESPHLLSVVIHLNVHVVCDVGLTLRAPTGCVPKAFKFYTNALAAHLVPRLVMPSMGIN
jgi:hypothetical protein